MRKLKGITVTLYEKSKVGEDAFHHPIYEEIPVEVDNVLVAPVSSTERLDTHNLIGKNVIYQLAIPKGDTHSWENCRVQFFGEMWLCLNVPEEGIDDLIPLDWNKKVQVGRYE